MVSLTNGTSNETGNGTWFDPIHNPQLEGCPKIPPLLASGSIWSGKNPFHYTYPVVLFQTFLVVSISQVLYHFLRHLGQTKLVCNLMAGIILGSSVLGQNKKFRETIYGSKDIALFDTLGVMGTIYSLFLIAVKVDILMVRRKAKTAFKIGLAGFILPNVITVFIVNPLTNTTPGFNTPVPVNRLLAAFSLSFTYYPDIAQALDDFKLMTSELSQLAMSTALLCTLIQWFCSTMQLIIMQGKATYGIGSLIALLALITLSIYIIRPLLMLIVEQTPDGKEIKEQYIVAIQVGVLAMAFLSDFLGLSYTTGPIILGLILPPGQPLGATMVKKTEYLVTEFLMPIFFLRVGIYVDAPLVGHWSGFVRLYFLIIQAYTAKIVGVTVAAMFCKIKFKDGVLLGLILNIKGIIEFMTYNRLLVNKVITNESFTEAVLSMLLVTMITTAIVQFSLKRRLLVEDSSKVPGIRSIQSMSNDSNVFRILCCVHNEESVRNMINLLEASNPTEVNPIYVYVVHAVELTGRSTPVLVPYNKHKSKYRRSDTPTNQMMRAFENYSQNSKGQVIIHAYNMIARYKSMHEHIFRLALEKVVPLVIIPFHESEMCDLEFGKAGSIRQFNQNVQASSPCTVGILVERGMSRRMALAHFSFNLGVFFIGEADDREALAYASHMSDNPVVEINVFRFILRNKVEGNYEEQQQFKLDESLIEEFKMRNIGNDRLNWRDIEVADGVAIVHVIRNLEGDYDLVMVGRKHAAKAIKEEEMTEFVENRELGVIGDMLASSDFCGGTANVLVLQQSKNLGDGALRCESMKSSQGSRLSSFMLQGYKS